jgi:hypothetical protein
MTQGAALFSCWSRSPHKNNIFCTTVYSHRKESELEPGPHNFPSGAAAWLSNCARLRKTHGYTGIRTFLKAENSRRHILWLIAYLIMVLTSVKCSLFTLQYIVRSPQLNVLIKQFPKPCKENMIFDSTSVKICFSCLEYDFTRLRIWTIDIGIHI